MVVKFDLFLYIFNLLYDMVRYTISKSETTKSFEKNDGNYKNNGNYDIIIRIE